MEQNRFIGGDELHLSFFWQIFDLSHLDRTAAALDDYGTGCPFQNNVLVRICDVHISSQYLRSGKSDGSLIGCLSGQDFFCFRAFNIFSGVIGSSLIQTPVALAIAWAIAARTGRVAPSPTSLAP